MIHTTHLILIQPKLGTNFLRGGGKCYATTILENSRVITSVHTVLTVHRNGETIPSNLQYTLLVDHVTYVQLFLTICVNAQIIMSAS